MIKFFDDKDHNFKAWVGTILKPLQVMEDLIIYEEGEEINDSKEFLILNIFNSIFPDQGQRWSSYQFKVSN